MDLELTIRQVVRDVVREELRAALAEVRPAQAAAEFLTVAQAAEVAQVAPDTIRLWIQAGRLPRRHAGRELRVRREDLERFMAEGPDKAPSAEAAVAATLGKRR